MEIEQRVGAPGQAAAEALDRLARFPGVPGGSGGEARPARVRGDGGRGPRYQRPEVHHAGAAVAPAGHPAGIAGRRAAVTFRGRLSIPAPARAAAPALGGLRELAEAGGEAGG